MDSEKADGTMYPIAEEEEGASALPAGTNENPSHSQNARWVLTPMGADIWDGISLTGTSARRGSMVGGRFTRGGGGNMFIGRRPFRYRQYINDRKLSTEGQRKGDQPKNEPGKVSGGAGSKPQESTSSDEAAQGSNAWSKPPVEKENESEQVVEGEQSHSKSWSAPGGFSAYFNTVSEQTRESNGLPRAATPGNEQQSSGSANSDDNAEEANKKKQFNRAPGSSPYARANRRMRNLSFQHGRYWVQGPDLSVSNTRGEYECNETRRHGRGACHNTARAGQRGDQKRGFSASGRNYCRGAGNWTRGGGNYFRDSSNWLRSTGDFSRRGNGCPRDAANCTRGGGNYLQDPSDWLPSTGNFSRRGNCCPRGLGYWSRNTADFGRRGNSCFRGLGSYSSNTGDFCRRGNSCARGGRRPCSRRGAQGRRQRAGYLNRRPTVEDREPSPPLESNAESSATTTIELGISTFTAPHEPSFDISDPSDMLIHRVTISDRTTCDYMSVEVRAQLPPEEQQGALWTFDVPFPVPQYTRPVMPVMVPQNPPVGTPVYYQQPVMGPAWSPYVPLVETYNEMPCYPAEYGNPGYYPPAFANPMYQNNPMEYMPPNPAGDPAGAVQPNPAVPPQGEVQQTGEAPSRPSVCSQCGGCGSCCTCTRPRTSPPLFNHESSASRTTSGPINFGAQKSVKDDGSDLPNDIATLRFFYNLGVEAHRSASRGVPNGDAGADQAQEDKTDEISTLVGRLHKVVFRQNPEQQESEEVSEEGGRRKKKKEDD